MATTTVRNIDTQKLKELAAKAGISLNQFMINAAVTYTSHWTYEGPDGPDYVEWWTHSAHEVGVTRSINNEGERTGYCLAYVETGEPTNANEYIEFDELSEAIEAAKEA